MNKLLLGTAAVALGLALASPAQAADGVKLGIGGYFKGYVSWLDQDTTPDDATDVDDTSEDERSFDTLRDTEINFTGETTLDNGLTVGFHTELRDDQGDSFDVDESYAYFSGAWGRVNFGAEDGAAYLLQVAAPSADANVDGLRQYVQPVNYNILRAAAGTSPFTTDNAGFDEIFGGVALAANTVIVDSDGTDTGTAGDIRLGANGVTRGIGTATRFDYDQAVSASDDKLTYLTPVFSGFQFGASYTPELDATSNSLGGHTDDDSLNQYGDVWDVAARWEGMLGEVGIAFGGGYSHASLESDESAADGDNTVDPVFYNDVDAGGTFTLGTDTVVATLDDREAWNVGGDLNWGAFGLGAVYTEDDQGVSGDNFQRETWVVGIDYTTGPFKLGGTYYTQDQAYSSAELETDRWTGGVIYTYGPGMTFRGSISYIEHDEGVGFSADNVDATSVLLGTQIDF